MRAARRFRHAWRLVAAVAAVALACLGVLGVPRPHRRPDRIPVHLRLGRHAVRGRLQHRARALRRLRRAVVSGQARLGRRHRQRRIVSGGYGNATEQDVFCAHTNCVITEVYDQSGRGNNLTIEGAGGAAGRTSAPTPPRCRSRSAATRSTASTSTGRPATGTTAPPRSRSTASPRACTWSPAAPTSTPAAASTSATPRPTPATTGRPHGRGQPDHLLRVLAVLGKRSLGRGRHGERPVRERERQQPERHKQQQRLRDRGAEEQRADVLRAQGR